MYLQRGRNVRRSRRYVSAVLRISLILSLWDAPLPWIHAHPALATDDGLVSHLTRYHLAADETRSKSDWHLHFLVPWFEIAETETPWSDGDSDQENRVIGGRGRNSLARGRQDRQLGRIRLFSGGGAFFTVHRADCFHTGFSPNRCLTRPGHCFLGTYAGAVSLDALLCIALC
jgi:hypothetical protein